MQPKSLDDHFRDWEADAFGFGYGSGEEHILTVLKLFMSNIGRDDADHGYDYRKLELVCGPSNAWFLINLLCHKDLINYGTSPRFGWLEPEGMALKQFIDSHSTEDLVVLCTTADENYIHCYPGVCNHTGNHYIDGPVCPNPFWPNRKPYL